MTGQNSMSLDAPWKPRGIGMGHRWLCHGCKQQRATTAGSKGLGIKKRCAQCVAAKAEKEKTP